VHIKVKSDGRFSEDTCSGSPGLTPQANYLEPQPEYFANQTTALDLQQLCIRKTFERRFLAAMRHKQAMHESNCA
jgi:hypothetical protein